MDKKRRDLLLAVVLVAVFFVSLMKNVVLRGRPSSPSAAAVAAAGPAGPADLSFLADVRRNEDLLNAQEAVWKKEWARDPFLSVPQRRAGANVAEKLSLSGIVWDDRMPYAMVNGQVLKVGDSLEGYMVVEIRQSSIVLYSDRDKFVELRLFETPGRKAEGPA